MAQKIIVTGGAGYIGSHTTVALQDAGFDVIVLDNLINSSEKSLHGVEKITGIHPEFIHVDCTDRDATRNAFKKHSDAVGVIHFAGLKAVGESVEKPLMYYRNNLDSLINVLEMMREFNIPNIVFSSSATVYGNPDILPVTEETPLKPAQSPYGQTKVMGEEIIRDMVRATPTINATLLRYFNPIGAHPSGQIGENPRGIPNNLMPYITQTAIGMREQLSIFGDDYDTDDGFCVRDYIDVNDLARAHVAALRHMINGAHGANVFNLGTGHGVSVMEMVNAFESATGVKIKYKIAPRRPGDVPAIWADATHAKRVLGWSANTPLVDTLASAWRWQQNPDAKD
ncbi:MAG: UDP-glucose 4-epimerase GalE [Alphaproteobacteria bacterium]|nr:UDP-glucose 4-epimerase GalE [Alphaproteobacteria bacterium]